MAWLRAPLSLMPIEQVEWVRLVEAQILRQRRDIFWPKSALDVQLDAIERAKIDPISCGNDQIRKL